MPVVADFARPSRFQAASAISPKLGFFPGSTIGNFVPWSATDLLRQFRALLGPGAQLLIGMDRMKPVERLLAAYDDPKASPPQFNLNLLDRINRELDGDIPLDAFRHEARWNDILSRIEMHLVASARRRFHDRRPNASASTQGASIHTENSHKYGERGARVLLLAGGWTPSPNGPTATATSPRSSRSPSRRGLRLNGRAAKRRPCLLPSSKSPTSCSAILTWIIIGQVILSWLLAFNILNVSSGGVRAFIVALDRITAPIYRPIRRLLPDFGGIDFSPIVVLILIQVIKKLLAGVVAAILLAAG